MNNSFQPYCYRRLPFGISSAPEFFRKRMSTILDGLPSVTRLVDDILVMSMTSDYRQSSNASPKQD